MHPNPHTGNGALQRFRATYGRLLEWVVGILMVALALEVTLGIVFRAIGQSLVWYDEVASILLAWLTFYGSALASVNRAHIGCPELVQQLPAPARRVVDIFAQLLVIGFFALFGWIGLSIMPALEGDTMVSLAWMPMNVVQSVIPISSGLILVGELLHLFELCGPRRAAASHPGVAVADALH
jgi:TRAP-type C4-dicarboxylate transport system permease small subunit